MLKKRVVFDSFIQIKELPSPRQAKTESSSAGEQLVRDMFDKTDEKVKKEGLSVKG